MKSKCSFILKASTALVLALLMLFGTVTTSLAAVVDELADTRAEADIADTGWWWTGGDYRLIGDFNNWAWDSNYLTLSESSGTYTGTMYLYGSASPSNFKFAFLNRNDSGTRFNPYGNSDFKLTDNTNYGTDGSQDGKCFYLERKTQLGSSASTLYQVDLQLRRIKINLM